MLAINTAMKVTVNPITNGDAPRCNAQLVCNKILILITGSLQATGKNFV